MGVKIVVGLGNPGIAYEKSRHNIGFQALDRLAERLSIRVTKKGFSGVYGDGVRNGEKVILVKPETYMNLSGNCVQAIAHFFKAAPEDTVILYDDIDLPVGALRIRSNGSAGTHNGMRSVLACLGSDNVPRVRIGAGNERSGDLKDFVLAKPSKEEQETLERMFDAAADAAILILDGKIADAQAKYNKKHSGTGNKPPEKAE